MSRMEDLLRAGIQDYTSSVAPGSIPPLDLSGARWDERTRPFRPGWKPGWRPGVVVPALAAALVVAVVALTLALPHLLRTAGAPAAPGRVTPAAGVPRYYVASSEPQQGRQLTPANALVMDDQTGAVLATVRPPAGYASFALFGGGTADDETFVVAAQKYWHPAWDGYYETNSLQPITFFTLTIIPATRHVTLRRLPDLRVATTRSLGHPTAPGGGMVTQQPVNRSDVLSFALSPDGTRLAVVLAGYAPGGFQAMTVHVLPLASGVAARSWQLAANNRTSPAAVYSLLGVNTLSWSPDGRVLAASYWTSAVLIDVTRPSGELLANSKVINFATVPPAGATRGNRFSCVPSGPVFTGGGAELACVAAIFSDHPSMGTRVATAIATFSAATGHLVSLSYVRPYQPNGAGSLSGIGWISPAGDVIIGYQANGKATYPPNGSTGPDGRVAIVEISGERVVRALAEPTWAASSPFFSGWDGYIGW